MSWIGSIALGEGWISFKGQSADNKLHAHPTTQVMVPLEGLVLVQDKIGLAHRHAGIVIMPGVHHRVTSIGPVLMLLVAPFCSLGQSIKHLALECASSSIFALPDSISTQVREQARVDVLLQMLAQYQGLLAPKDRRLLKVLDILAEQQGPKAIGIAATSVGISTSRLRYLAQQQLGLSLSDWLIWQKVLGAGLSMRRGSSLAQAAVDGGFADQAHFTRVLQLVLGVSPGMLVALFSHRASGSLVSVAERAM